MSYFAKVKDGKVIDMLVAEQDFVDSYSDGKAGVWIQCSYNVIGGVYYDPSTGEPAETQSDFINDENPARKRKNYPSVGWNYDITRDAFYDIQPYPSWTLNETTCEWEPPVDRPDYDNIYTWNEETQTWDAVESE